MHPTALGPLVRSIGLTVGLAVALTPFAGAVRAQISQPFTPSGSVELAPGILFTQGTMRTAGRLPQMVRVATIDPRVPTARIRSLLSNDSVPQRERPSKLALRKSTPEPEGDGGHQRRHVRGGPPGRVRSADLAARL